MITYDLEKTSEKWNNIANGYDKYVTPSHEWLGSEGARRAGIKSGIRFLDVAAGSGALSLPAARAGAKVTSVDLSPVMLDLLKRNAKDEGLDIETRVMDGHQLEFEDNTFDVSGSQFGVMLFPDMPRALREMVRVTKPDGRVFLHVMGDVKKNEFFTFFLEAIQAAVPEFTGPPMDPPPLPFQLQDPKKLSKELLKAGLRDVGVETIVEELKYQSGRGLWLWIINSNPIAATILEELKLTPDQVDVIRRKMDQMIDQRSNGKEYAVLKVQIHIGSGRKSG